MKAYDFSLKDKNGVLHSLKDIKSDYIILYFYPKDSTPGCTIEANEFNNHLQDFKKLKATIIGISGGNEKTKTKFSAKYKLNILLLSDSEFKVSKKYKSYGEKTFMGVKFNGIFRNTFILDKNKNIIKTFEKVKAEGHALEVINFLKTL
ncbi:MAG TPA: peroxiredoxin [Candidatus Nanoarchaeia archaeon]|nr:peroxiredoxin [Candidatus Nanoarchaeia archaeon]